MDELAAKFAADGHVEVPDFLPAAAAGTLREHLLRRSDWLEILNSGDRLFELSRTVRNDFDDDRRARLDHAIHDSARHGFQYRYEAIRVPDDRAMRLAADPLHAFADMLCAPGTIAMIRRITGQADIAFADAQATAYRPGDFLSGHDDGVPGKHRRAAYVFGLTRNWRLEWGGLLMFHRHDATVAEAVLPGFNRLMLFAVPQPHSVSLVAPYADGPRLSVTGWMRATG